ncbi:MAG: universal stress protein, partial [Chloroflexi bacterium]|nr:universal stress protein [Chloroflexota bacterium]
MLRTILVPYDGSPLSECALPYAETIALRTSSQIILVQAAEDLVARRHAERTLTAVAERWWKQGIAVETHVRSISPGTLIVNAAHTWAAGLIVMSTHGRSGLGRWLYGSVADFVLRHADVPILLVPATSERVWSAAPHVPETPLARVLVPLDGSPFAEEALGPAQELAAALGAGLLLVHVVLPFAAYGPLGQRVPYDPADLRIKLERKQQYLAEVAARLRRPAMDVATSAEISESPATMIARLAHDREVDAIAMATHGRGGAARLG